ECAVTNRHSELFALGFFGRNIQEKLILIRDWCWLNLEHAEQTRPHQRSKAFVQNFRTVSLTLLSREPLLDEAWMQSRQAINKDFAAEVINQTGRNGDIHRDATVDCGRRF